MFSLYQREPLSYEVEGSPRPLTIPNFCLQPNLTLARASCPLGLCSLQSSAMLSWKPRSQGESSNPCTGLGSWAQLLKWHQLFQSGVQSGFSCSVWTFTWLSAASLWTVVGKVVHVLCEPSPEVVECHKPSETPLLSVKWRGWAQRTDVWRNCFRIIIIY